MSIGAVNSDDAINSLIDLRSKCPALNKILLPDGIWDKYLKKAREPVDEAHHYPFILGMLVKGRLSVLTKPIHKYILEGDEVSPKLDRNYRRDLQDAWFLEGEGAMKRHTVFKRSSGKVFELISLDWFEKNGYTVSGLAAVGGEADIELKGGGEKCLIEMKYIGMSNDLFNSIVKSLRNEPSAYSASPYDSVNFILSRIYEAGVQLSQLKASDDEKRVATIVLSPFTWDDVGNLIVDGWIDWTNPTFFEDGVSDDWNKFYKCLIKKYPAIDHDLKDVIHKNVDEIWLFKEYPHTVLHREKVVVLG